MPQAQFYAQQLVVTEKRKRNIEAMSANEKPNHYHRVQHFISESPWSSRQLMNSVAKDISCLFEADSSVGLLVDEASEEKKGNRSVGVAPQYCGNLGKKANCQTAVFATLTAGEHFSIIDAELYLPQSWIEDKERRKEAGVPDDIVYQKKSDLALKIIARQKEEGRRMDYVCGDGFYGHGTGFRTGLDVLGLLFVLDIHKDTKIYTEEFEIEVPIKIPNSKGKTPTLAKANKESQRVDKYEQGLQESDWQKEVLRNGSKGSLYSLVHGKEIYVEEDGKCVKRTLIIRKTKEHNRYRTHYILSNGDLGKYSLNQLASYQAQRFYVEQSIKEARQNMGMYEYQVRGWLAWHHHIAMTIMAMAFFTMEKKEHEDHLPLLSYADIREAIIDNCLQTQKPLPFEEKLSIRHYKRQKDINRFYTKHQT